MPVFKEKPDTCQGCPAYKEGKSYVPGHGNRDALVAYVGQGPGELEAHQGRPFVGDSGIKLDEWNHAANVSRKDAWFTNIVHCWLTRQSKTGRTINRDPTDAEITYCMEAHVKPELLSLPNLKVIIPVGIPAAEVFIGQSANERDAGAQFRFKDRNAAIRAARVVRAKDRAKSKPGDLVPQVPGLGAVRVRPTIDANSGQLREAIGKLIEGNGESSEGTVG